ncbi:hypothetical protein E7744_01045 [Citricoccus sp. SGAir0253]|uniref:sigma 54-interacting transcriptional regulator n=1 Tax=Citricoccus sp. SGAir0253 TaxID=2567881 RepID=UPI0010CD5CD2|nr:sigma 54-interacting transcriptional regulator [Citricoccus sp. SGAir0253]QCU76968.1 hypothetical protein E7744_01045 [Citricoccus sp. SGAir0253]
MEWAVDLGRREWTRQLLDECRRSGIDLAPVDHPDPSDVGIVLAEAWSADLARVLEEAAGLRCRVMVVGGADRGVDPWPVLAAGAAECLPWSGDPDPVCAWVRREREVAGLLGSPAVRRHVLGTSRALTEALRDLVVASRYGRAPILIQGETGTGKELAARVAHAVGTARGSLVVVDCSTITPTLLGSELFGHEKGAYTGAVSVRTGACAAADGGTLFLDEIGELPPEVQPDLLRVVQEGTYKRVGGDRWLHSDFRLVCATNRRLDVEVRQGRFRADLYHRIAAITVTLPPLRDRMEDAVALFLRFCAEALGREDQRLDPAVERLLLERDYPGNLRDLRQLAHRVAARHVGRGPITPGDLPPADRPVPGLVVGWPGLPDVAGDPGAAQAPARPGAGDAERGSPAAGVPGPEAPGELQTAPAGPPAPGLAAGCVDGHDPVRAAVAWALDRGLGLQDIKALAGTVALDEAVERSEGNLRTAASLLGVSVRAVQQRRAVRSAAGDRAAAPGGDGRAPGADAGPQGSGVGPPAGPRAGALAGPLADPPTSPPDSSPASSRQ